MPVDLFSRYRNLDTLEIARPAGGTTRSLPIRRRPSQPSSSRNRQHRFGSYETADLLALKYFGRGSLYWHLLDANSEWTQVELVADGEAESTIGSAAVRPPTRRLTEKSIRLPDDFQPGEMLTIPPISSTTRVERRIF